MAYNAPTISFTALLPWLPGPVNLDSFIDVQITSSGPLNPGAPGNIYDAWCLDRSLVISPGAYTAQLYSSYELTILQASRLGSLTFTQAPYINNLDNINWLLNQDFNAGPTYSWREVQAAIWLLSGSDPVGSTSIVGYDAAEAATLVNLAQTNGEGFVPGLGQTIGLILDTGDLGTNIQRQPLILEVKSAALGDFVWNDANANGIQDSGEAGIQGATVKLVRDLDKSGTITADEVLATTTTNSSGLYSFTGLTPGLDYQVQFTQPGGLTPSPRQVDGNPTSGVNSDGLLSNVVVLAPGENNTSIDAGFFDPTLLRASLGDRLWVDTNADGKQDTNTTLEPGVVGATVTLIGGGADGLINGVGDTTTTTTTGANGVYTFTNLTPGVQYQVQFTAPNGTVFTTPNVSANGFDAVDSDADKVTGKSQVITLAPGENNTSVDAGVYAPAKLSGYVYQDAGNDGVRNNEPGINGVVLTLTGTDNAGNAVNLTTTTNSLGFYEFVGLAPGNYAVTETQPGGFIDGKDTPGSTGGSNATNDVISAITLTAGANSTENNFGELVSAGLGDRLWVDTDGDGKQSADQTAEPGIGNQVITLIGGGADGIINGIGDTTATTTTFSNGFYSFVGLTPGVEYQVQFSKPAGTVFTSPNVTANTFDTVDSDANTTTGRSQVVTLGQGEFNSTIDAGVYTPAKLSGYVYQDVGNDGVRNNEPGIGGVVLTLTGTDNAGNSVTGTATTNTAGFYEFVGLPPGKYTVSEAQPNGFLDGKDTIGSTGGTVANDLLSNITLASGSNSTENNFGELKPASLGDRLWVDTNGDGKQDANTTTEPGVVGAVVTLIGGGADGLINGVGDTTATTTTGANGVYAFTNLTPGVQYQVQFVAPAGTVFTTPNVSTNGFDEIDSDANKATGLTQVVTLGQGEDNRTLDAGVYAPGKLTGFVYVDSNDDGSRAGEAPIQGVVLTLSGTDNAGNVVTGITTTTDGSGFYQFTNLAPGSYTVTETQPANFNDGKDTVGTTGGSNAVNDVLSSVTVTAGGTSAENNFGERTRTASLGDRLWVDTNGDGKQDANTTTEPGVVGAVVTLIGGGADGLINGVGDTTATTTTGTNGVYAFTNLTPGVQYQVQFAAPAGTVFTTPNVSTNGFDLVDSDANKTTGRTQIVTLADNENNTSLDAGVYAPGKLTGFVYVDSNDDGSRAGEAPIQGVTLTLSGVDNAGNVITGVTTVTEPNGFYEFTNLAPGSYTVTETQPANFNDGKDTVGTTGGSNAVNDVLSGIAVTAGGVSNENNFGERVQTTRLGDFLFEDTNGNGIQDPLEPGIGGVVVSLKNAAGTVINTTTTSATGAYGFDVNPGTYSVQFATPAGGFVFTRRDSGADDAKDSDADATGNTGPYTVVAGQPNLTIDAGVYKTAAIGDRIWYDKHVNGIQDPGEANIAGVKVDLYNDATGAIIATQTTDANGLYLFSNLAPGSYHVDVAEETLPAGFVFTRPNQGGNDALDSDVETLGGTVPLSWGVMASTSLTSGELDRTWDAGVYKIGIDVEKYVSGTKTTTTSHGGTEGGDCDHWKNNCQSTTTSTWGITGYFLGVFPQYGWINTSTPSGWSGINQCKASDSFNALFGVSCTNGHKSIYDILCGTGTSSYDKWQRECVAAYLNACHNKVDYAFSPEQVCAEIKHALNTGNYDHTCNLFKCENDKGCDWNTDCTNTTTTVDTTLYDADSPPGLEVKTGSLVTFTYIVKNTGDTPLSNISLTDDRIQTVTYVSGDTNNNGLLDLTESWTYKATEVAQQGTIKNVGTVVGTDTVGGTKVTDNDPAYYTGTGALKSSIGDRVWWDKDNDGVQDNGETGISGVVVTLKGAGADLVFGNADDITAVTTTGTNGTYLFPNLAAGNYTVEFGNAAGYVRTGANLGGNDALDSDADASGKTGVITLGANQQNLTVDAGYIKPGIDVEKYVSGVKTTTTNVCGGEGAHVNYWKANCVGGINWSGLTCKGTDTFGSIFGVTCTGSNNSIYNILCGTGTSAYDKWQRECVAAYLNSCHDKVNYAYTKDQICADVKWALACGDYTNMGNKFAYENNLGCTFTNTHSTYTSTVDTQLYDADSPPGLEVSTGSLVTFTYIVKNTGPVALKDVVLTDDRIATVTYLGGDGNSNGLLDTHETWTYKATETASAGTIKNTGTVTAKDAGTGTVTVTDKDDAYYTGSGSTKGSIGDRLWHDADNDGIQEAHEGGVGGVKVILTGYGKDGLLGTADDITSVTTTSSTGAYLFGNLDAGKYKLDFGDALGKGYTFTKQDQGTSMEVDSDVNASGVLDGINLGAGQQSLNLDAGVYRKSDGLISGFVSNDLNNDGQRNGDPALSGVTVTLTGTTTTGQAVTATAVTDVSGFYKFSNLAPGTYFVTETQPAGWIDGKDTAGSLGSSVVANDRIQVVLPSSGVSLENNFFEYKKAAVGDKVWSDSNHNGIQDTGEAGISNVKVTLFNATTNVAVASMLTNLAGNYSFTNLDPGSYYLQFDKTNVIFSGVNLNTWKWGLKDIGTNDHIDSDANNPGSTVNITRTDAFTLTSGLNDTSRDAAITPLVIDMDGNGIRTVSLANSSGTFDLLGNGTAIKSGWISAGDAFLAVDKDSNGSIDSVNELFGGTAKGAGFAALASYDSNKDGLVDGADADFAKLLVWQDANGDHQSSADELRTLAQAGIASLTVAHTDLQFLDAQGNVHGEASSVTTTSGTTLGMTDIYFSVDAADVAGTALPSVSELLGNTTLDSLVGAAELTTDASSLKTEAACDDCAGEALSRLAALHREDQLQAA